MALHRMPTPPKPGIPLIEEQKQAIMAVAGRLKEGPTMALCAEEIQNFRERLRLEEIADREVRELW